MRTQEYVHAMFMPPKPPPTQPLVTSHHNHLQEDCPSCYKIMLGGVEPILTDHITGIMCHIQFKAIMMVCFRHSESHLALINITSQPHRAASHAQRHIPNVDAHKYWLRKHWCVSALPAMYPAISRPEVAPCIRRWSGRGEYGESWLGDVGILPESSQRIISAAIAAGIQVEAATTAVMYAMSGGGPEVARRQGRLPT